MAIFYYPNRSAPTTTLTIGGLEKFPSDRPIEKLQSVDVTPGGTEIVYDLGPTIEYVPIKMRALSDANRTSLLSFIQTTVNYREKTFDFTDDQSNQYDTCRFVFDRVSFQQIAPDLYDEDVLLRLVS